MFLWWFMGSWYSWSLFRRCCCSCTVLVIYWWSGVLSWWSSVFTKMYCSHGFLSWLCCCFRSCCVLLQILLHSFKSFFMYLCCFWKSWKCGLSQLLDFPGCSDGNRRTRTTLVLADYADSDYWCLTGNRRIYITLCWFRSADHSGAPISSCQVVWKLWRKWRKLWDCDSCSSVCVCVVFVDNGVTLKKS